MNKRCSYCGISVDGGVSCPLCGTRLVTVNLRRLLLWALVAEEYLMALVIFRFR